MLLPTSTTITGSIGIFGAFPTFEKSLKSLGITSDGVGTTELSDAFDPSRPLNDLIAQSMNQMIERGYQRFIQRVAQGRNMEPEAVEKIAQGRVWAGITAQELGLVDEIGNLEDTIRAAADQADLKDYEIKYITQPLTTREQLIKRLNRLITALIDFSQPSGHPVQKIYDTVVDGEIGFVGGHNVGDEYLGDHDEFGHWRDTHVQITGPAALQAQSVFFTDWYWAEFLREGLLRLLATGAGG